MSSNTEQSSTSKELLAAGSIRSVAYALRQAEVSSTELVRAALAIIKRENGSLHAFVDTFDDRALMHAAAADERIAAGRGRGPLDGVPVAVKENFAMTGQLWESGSTVLANNRAQQNAAVVDALETAGAVIIGSTTMDEFALTTVGRARTPLDPTRTAGGSSGGSGSAVASGMVFAALGSDTGGSVRIPAATCGIVGFKPSMNLIPTEGVTSLAWSLDHVGVLARTAEDVRIMMSAMIAGVQNQQKFESSISDDASLKGTRIGVPSEDFLAVCDEAVLEDYQRSIRASKNAGAVLIPVNLPLTHEIGAMHWSILAAEMRAYHINRFGVGEDRYLSALTDALKNAAQITREDYLSAQRKRGRLRSHMDDILQSVNIIALPTMPSLPPIAGQTFIGTSKPEDATTVMVRLTSLANHTGHPALSLRPGFFPNNHMFGLQLIGPFLGDEQLLKYATAFETAEDSEART